MSNDWLFLKYIPIIILRIEMHGTAYRVRKASWRFGIVGWLENPLLLLFVCVGWRQLLKEREANNNALRIIETPFMPMRFPV